jgi:L-fuculose-phosphate aldolase
VNAPAPPGQNPAGQLAEDLVRAAGELHRTGNVGASGNLSVRTREGLLITPSGIPYDQLGPASMVALDPAGAPLGAGKPSSEWRFHCDIYRTIPAAGAIVHSHSPHATALACLGRAIPAFHYEVAFAGGADIRCADYATFGTQALSDNVLRALEGRQACLLANHGMLAYAENLDRAMALAAKVEQLARIYALCLAIGEPRLLDTAEMERIQDLFLDYGQPGMDGRGD